MNDVCIGIQDRLICFHAIFTETNFNDPYCRYRFAFNSCVIDHKCFKHVSLLYFIAFIILVLNIICTSKFGHIIHQFVIKVAISFSLLNSSNLAFSLLSSASHTLAEASGISCNELCDQLPKVMCDPMISFVFVQTRSPLKIPALRPLE